MDAYTTVLLTMIGSAIGLSVWWIISLFLDAKAEGERQRKALNIAFNQMAKPGLYRCCDNAVKAMHETLNGGKSGE